MPLQKRFFSSPGRAILCSVLFTIMFGALLLSCSWAQRIPISFIDALFTATSATCVTGLMTIPLAAFTTAGQIIILCLIQIGALGLVTLTIFLLSLFVNVGLSTSSMTGEILEVGMIRHPRQMVFFIIIFTIVVEFCGFLILFLMTRHLFPFPQSIFFALFQAVSAFCNAGFILLPYQIFFSHPGILATTATLVLIGGLGFIVWAEIARYIRSFQEMKHFHLSLHSKLVLATTTFLIAFLGLIIFLLEYVRAFFMHPSLTLVTNTLFNAICLRSAGFTTLDLSAIHLATVFVIMIVAFIGSSPGSVGSGIKTTTFAVFVAAIRATVLRRTWVEIMGRTIPNEQVFKAMAIFSLSLCWVAATIFFLLLTEQGWRFIDIIFEAFAAFSNLGLSTGITPHLSSQGKCIIMISMFIGRIGSLTLLLALRKQRSTQEFHYPEESVLMS